MSRQKLSPKQKKTLQVKTYYHNLINQVYTEEPVDIITFISSPKFLGASTDNGRGVYPYWKNALKEIFDDNGKIIIVLTGSIGTGKSTCAIYSLCYIQYRLMLLRDPYKFFGLNPGRKMTFGFFNLNKSLGDSAGFNKMMSILSASPWFQENAIRKTETKRGTQLEFSLIDYALASPYSRGFGIVGADLASGVMDEVDSPMDPLKQKERVIEAYSAMFTRFQSRFAPNNYSIGKLFVVCSRQDESAFIDTFIAEKKQTSEEQMHVYDPAIWEVKPKGTYHEETFPVSVGNQYNPPKIISEDEVEKYLAEGFQVVRPPIDFKSDFQMNIIRSLRDIAGKSVTGTHKFSLFPSDSYITDSFDPEKEDPVKVPLIRTGLQDPLDLVGYIDFSKIRLPKYTPRYIHYDISFTGDASGIAMSGIKDWKYVDVMNPDGTWRQDLLPIVETDFCIRIKAFDGDRIPPHKVRKLVLDIKAMGYNIGKFTADLQMASEETLQLLKQAGVNTEYISVDKSNKAYFDFRNAIFEKRWVCHNHPQLFFELKHLECSPLDGKVDHPKKVKTVEFINVGELQDVVVEGSKDVADAVCGSVAQCLYSNTRPVDVQMVSDALKRANPPKPSLFEDVSKLFKLQDGEGKEIILPNPDKTEYINNIFKRLRR